MLLSHQDFGNITAPFILVAVGKTLLLLLLQFCIGCAVLLYRREYHHTKKYLS